MSITLKIIEDEKGKSVDQHGYRSMIKVCARYQTDLKVSHKKDVKQVLRYMNCTSDHGIFYSRNTKTHFVGYNDTHQGRNCAEYITIGCCCA